MTTTLILQLYALSALLSAFSFIQLGKYICRDYPKDYDEDDWWMFIIITIVPPAILLLIIVALVKFLERSPGVKALGSALCAPLRFTGSTWRSALRSLTKEHSWKRPPKHAKTLQEAVTGKKAKPPRDTPFTRKGWRDTDTFVVLSSAGGITSGAHVRIETDDGSTWPLFQRVSDGYLGFLELDNIRRV